MVVPQMEYGDEWGICRVYWNQEPPLTSMVTPLR
jgi:hypothetical protein